MLSEDMAEAANQECPILDKVYEDQTVVGISGKKVEFDTVKFVRCRMEESDFSGASFHGENGICAEYHTECGDSCQCADGGVLSGNEPGAAG